MADVRDVDLELPVAAGQALHVHGVVEVTCGFPVDGDDREAAKIVAEGELFRAECVHGLLGGSGGFGENVCGKLVRAGGACG